MDDSGVQAQEIPSEVDHLHVDGEHVEGQFESVTISLAYEPSVGARLDWLVGQLGGRTTMLKQATIFPPQALRRWATRTRLGGDIRIEASRLTHLDARVIPAPRIRIADSTLWLSYLDAPNLERLVATNSGFLWKLVSHCNKLKELEVDVAHHQDDIRGLKLEQVLTALLKTVSLQSLSLHCQFDHNPFPRPPCFATTVYLPHLRSLSLRGEPFACRKFLERLHLPALVTLRLGSRSTSNSFDNPESILESIPTFRSNTLRIEHSFLCLQDLRDQQGHVLESAQVEDTGGPHQFQSAPETWLSIIRVVKIEDRQSWQDSLPSVPSPSPDDCSIDYGSPLTHCQDCTSLSPHLVSYLRSFNRLKQLTVEDGRYHHIEVIPRSSRANDTFYSPKYTVTHLIPTTAAVAPSLIDINELPVELLIMIFKYSINATRRPSTVVVLASVCRHWRAVGLLVPDFWVVGDNSVTLDADSHDSQVDGIWAVRGIPSVNIPLTNLRSLTAARNSKALWKFLPELTALEALSVGCIGCPSEAESLPFKDLIEILRGLPALESLSLSRRYLTDIPYIRGAPFKPSKASRLDPILPNLQDLKLGGHHIPGLENLYDALLSHRTIPSVHMFRVYDAHLDPESVGRYVKFTITDKLQSNYIRPNHVVITVRPSPNLSAKFSGPTPFVLRLQAYHVSQESYPSSDLIFDLSVKIPKPESSAWDRLFHELHALGDGLGLLHVLSLEIDGWFSNPCSEPNGSETDNGTLGISLQVELRDALFTAMAYVKQLSIRGCSLQDIGTILNPSTLPQVRSEYRTLRRLSNELEELTIKRAGPQFPDRGNPIVAVLGGFPMLRRFNLEETPNAGPMVSRIIAEFVDEVYVDGERVNAEGRSHLLNCYGYGVTPKPLCDCSAYWGVV